MAAVIPFNPLPWGATPDDWQHLDLVLGLTEDLLPVVSNSKATISPNSSMKDVGKTPSTYNGNRQAIGFAQWTQHQTTPEEIARWAKERDYGICIQTRRIRAIDIDVTDPAAAQAVADVVLAHVGSLPARTRDNSPKLLLAFECPGELTKRKFKTEHGIVELLATGQQFVACGTHPSGVRYAWQSGLPDAFPVLTLDQVNALWSALATEFAIEDSSTQASSVKATKLSEVVANDPVAQFLLTTNRVKRSERDGRLHIICPWEDEHTSESSDSATTYWPAHTGGYVNGHFACLHAHCEHRTDQDFIDAVGYAPFDEFSDISAIDPSRDPIPGVPSSEPAAHGADVDPQPIPDSGAPKPARFRVIHEDEFDHLPSTQWIIKGVLPHAELGVLFGASGSGKSFFVLDLAAAIAQGLPWRGHKVRKGRVVYVAAEGAAGFRKRIKAYKHHHGIESLPIGLIEAAPNFRERADALEVAKQIKADGGADLVIVDTFAQVMPGGNENSGEDVGKVLEHCKGIRRATGAMVLVIHHTGKDQERGARGWSGLKAAADVEIEVVRADAERSATITKMKDGEDGAEFGFSLETVILGFDEDGDELSSCVVIHNERGAVSKRRAARGPLERVILGELQDLCGVSNDWVDEPRLIQAVVARMPFEGGRDTRAQRARKSIKGLAAAGALDDSPLGYRLGGEA